MREHLLKGVPALSQVLSEVERRVLGVLIEKSLAQPQYYPMTLNGVVTACNQKSNRDPVMTLDEDGVFGVLTALRERELVAMVLPSESSRVEKFKHQTDTAFGWERSQRAVMAELLLRGPQTVGELRTRCGRMVPMESIETVTAILESLSRLDPPVVAVMPRSPGQSAVRYTHLLFPDGEQPTTAGTCDPSAPAAAHDTSDAPGVASMQDQVDDMQAEIAELHEGLAELRRRLEVIENQLL